MKHNSHDIKSYKKYDKIRWILTGVCILFISITLVAFGLQLFGKGKAKPSEWFKQTDKQATNVVDETDTDSDVDGKSISVAEKNN